MKKDIEYIKEQLSGKHSREFMKSLSDDELKALIDIFEKDDDKIKPYYRNLDIIESQAISVEAYGYMLSMYRIGSLTEVTFEKVIQICMHLYYITQEQVSKSKLDKIIMMINFSDFNLNNIKEFIDTIINENKYQMNIHKIKH
ncbi:DUF494 family protein [bacterium]|nr:DUF494 family protein [bacterium]